MKLLRFMSVTEFDKFRAGELLENTAEHSARTDAVGFCFLDYDDYDEQYAYRFLSGIVSSEIVAVFQLDDATGLREGSGVFADPDGSSFFSSIQVDEYSTPRYHSRAFKLIKFCDDFSERYKEDSFDHVFEWKPADAPIRRRITVIDIDGLTLSSRVLYERGYSRNGLEQPL